MKTILLPLSARPIDHETPSNGFDVFADELFLVSWVLQSMHEAYSFLLSPCLLNICTS